RRAGLAVDVGLVLVSGQLAVGIAVGMFEDLGQSGIGLGFLLADAAVAVGVDVSPALVAAGRGGLVGLLRRGAGRSLLRFLLGGIGLFGLGFLRERHRHCQGGRQGQQANQRISVMTFHVGTPLGWWSARPNPCTPPLCRAPSESIPPRDRALHAALITSPANAFTHLVKAG